MTVTGILPAAITPRRADSAEIDLARGLDLIDFLCGHGVDGITLLGSTGEFPHFTPEDRIRFASMAIQRSRVPVLVNASHSTLEGAERIARAAIGDGAAGVLAMPPYYFRYSQESIRAFFLEFSESMKAPVYLYNIPQFASGIDVETSVALLATGAFAGIKDSLGRWEDFVRLQATGKTVFTGADTMYSRAARAGAAGAISGVASVLPELMVAIDRRARAGEDTAALDKRVAAFADRAMSFPFPIAFREALAIRGIDPGPHALPLGPEESKRMDEFRGWFRASLKEWI
jgi:dihydrodipicolinate synthase/N-acetylneuraminate lyase